MNQKKRKKKKSHEAATNTRKEVVGCRDTYISTVGGVVYYGGNSIRINSTQRWLVTRTVVQRWCRPWWSEGGVAGGCYCYAAAAAPGAVPVTHIRIKECVSQRRSNVFGLGQQPRGQRTHKHTHTHTH